MANTVMALVGLFCFGTLLATFLQCQPLQASWDAGVLAVCGNQTAAWVWTAVTNVVTDVVVLVLPIRGVWTLRLPRKIKIALMGVFGLGFLYVDPKHKHAARSYFITQCHICHFHRIHFKYM